MLSVDTLLELIERVERAMRPLASKSHGPDHDRVRELYMEFLTETPVDPLEQARVAVLHEILQPYLGGNQHTQENPAHTVVYNAKAAIGALVMLLCLLEENDYEAASTSLSAAAEIMQETQELLRGLLGDVAHA